MLGLFNVVKLNQFNKFKFFFCIWTSMSCRAEIELILLTGQAIARKKLLLILDNQDLLFVDLEYVFEI